LHTVTAADERGVTVLAVPGSVRSSASEGTNALIADGCGVARDAADVLASLELACAGTGLKPHNLPGPKPAARPGLKPDPRLGIAESLSPPERSVLAALDDVSIPFELVSDRSGLELAATAVSLERLAALGLAARSGSGWERASRSRA
jgi:predicted Rossmann fold nucleotide-binding protein DprA/Smf involved in DNA uptake